MGAGVWFWLIYVICVLFGCFLSWPKEPGPDRWRPFGASVVVFVLLGLLGWRTFGPPIQ